MIFYKCHHTIRRSLVPFLTATLLNFNAIFFLFVDGAPNNCGQLNGSHKFVEKFLKRPLTWLICLFHLAELPLKHLILYFDEGHSTAPNRISNGPLGMVIQAMSFTQFS